MLFLLPAYLLRGAPREPHWLTSFTSPLAISSAGGSTAEPSWMDLVGGDQDRGLSVSRRLAVSKESRVIGLKERPALGNNSSGNSKMETILTFYRVRELY